MGYEGIGYERVGIRGNRMYGQDSHLSFVQSCLCLRACLDISQIGDALVRYNDVLGLHTLATPSATGKVKCIQPIEFVACQIFLAICQECIKNGINCH